MPTKLRLFQTIEILKTDLLTTITASADQNQNKAYSVQLTKTQFSPVIIKEENSPHKPPPL